jgi:endo-1,4-beta-xylanase
MRMAILYICGTISAGAALGTAGSSASGPIRADTTSLRGAVGGRFLIGAAVNSAQIQGRDSLASKIVLEHFTSITSENLLKWKNLQPRRGVYEFQGADAYVAYAERHGLVAIGHTLVWGDATPSWVFHTTSGAPQSRDSVLNALQVHVATVVGRYRGRIRGWDVVNEVLAPDGSLRRSPWLNLLGEEYIEQAFRAARRSDSTAELYINEYGLEEPRKLAGMVRLLRHLESSGIRVDGVGIQAHYYLASPDLARLDTAIATFARLGYKVMLTELDVDVLPRFHGTGGSVSATAQPHLNPFPGELPDPLQGQLANRYAEIFRVILRHPQAVSRVTFWGVHDGASWRNNWPVRNRTNYPLLFDRRGEPKPAFRSAVTTLTRGP